MNIRIEIDCGNDAFKACAEMEVARILREVIGKFAFIDGPNFTPRDGTHRLRLRDKFGDACGVFIVENYP